MAEFSDSVDYKQVIERLKLSAKYVPYELQLVWMYEILVILIYLKTVDEKSVRRHNGKAVITLRNVPGLALYTGLAPKLVNALGMYRNTFVHNGYLDAKTNEVDILSDSTQLDLLQTITGVTLNLRNTLM